MSWFHRSRPVTDRLLADREKERMENDRRERIALVFLGTLNTAGFSYGDREKYQKMFRNAFSLVDLFVEASGGRS